MVGSVDTRAVATNALRLIGAARADLEKYYGKTAIEQVEVLYQLWTKGASEAVREGIEKLSKEDIVLMRYLYCDQKGYADYMLKRIKESKVDLEKLYEKTAIKKVERYYKSLFKAGYKSLTEPRGEQIGVLLANLLSDFFKEYSCYFLERIDNSQIFLEMIYGRSAIAEVVAYQQLLVAGKLYGERQATRRTMSKEGETLMLHLESDFQEQHIPYTLERIEGSRLDLEKNYKKSSVDRVEMLYRLLDEALFSELRVAMSKLSREGNMLIARLQDLCQMDFFQTPLKITNAKENITAASKEAVQLEKDQPDRYLDSVVAYSVEKLSNIVLYGGETALNYLPESIIRAYFRTVMEWAALEGIESKGEEKTYDWCVAHLVKHSMKALSYITLFNGKKILDYRSEEQMRILFRDIWEGVAYRLGSELLEKELREMLLSSSRSGYSPHVNAVLSKRKESTESAPLSLGRKKRQNLVTCRPCSLM